MHKETTSLVKKVGPVLVQWFSHKLLVLTISLIATPSASILVVIKILWTRPKVSGGSEPLKKKQ